MLDTALARLTSRGEETHSCKMLLPMDVMLAEKSIEAMPAVINAKLYIFSFKAFFIYEPTGTYSVTIAVEIEDISFTKC